MASFRYVFYSRMWFVILTTLVPSCVTICVNNNNDKPKTKVIWQNAESLHFCLYSPGGSIGCDGLAANSDVCNNKCLGLISPISFQRTPLPFKQWTSQVYCQMTSKSLERLNTVLQRDTWQTRTTYMYTGWAKKTGHVWALITQRCLPIERPV